MTGARNPDIDVDPFVHYVNGDYVGAEQATISIFDRCVLTGDAVFDTTRTFGGKPFRIEDHLDRLERSLRFVEIEPDLVISEVRDAVAEVTRRNQEALRTVGDAWIMIVVSRGRMADVGLGAVGAPTVLVYIKRFDLGVYAPLYDRGVDLVMSLMTRPFSGALDPRVKSTNRLALTRPELKGQRATTNDEERHGRSWGIVLTEGGSIAESNGSNLALLEGDRIVRPPRHMALEGISLATFSELADAAGMQLEERELWLYDFINADAVYLTGSSFSVLPVRSIDGIKLRRRDDFLRQIISAWIDLVGLDFVAQSKEFAS